MIQEEAYKIRFIDNSSASTGLFFTVFSPVLIWFSNETFIRLKTTFCFFHLYCVSTYIGSGEVAAVASVRRCQKLPPCLTDAEQE